MLRVPSPSVTMPEPDSVRIRDCPTVTPEMSTIPSACTPADAAARPAPESKAISPLEPIIKNGLTPTPTIVAGLPLTSNVTLALIVGKGDEIVIVAPGSAYENWMTSPLPAPAIACRNEPTPESLPSDAVKVVASLMEATRVRATKAVPVKKTNSGAHRRMHGGRQRDDGATPLSRRARARRPFPIRFDNFVGPCQSPHRRKIQWWFKIPALRPW